MSQAEGVTEPSQGAREVWPGAAANDEERPAGEGEG